MAYTDLTQIQEKINTHKSDLAANLTAKNVTANASEGFGVLIGKVKDIEQGGSGGGSLDWSTVTIMDHAFAQIGPQLLEFLLKSINCDMSQVTSWINSFYYGIKSAESNTVYQANKFPLTKLSKGMFYYCPELTDITFADDVDGDGLTDGQASIFYDCEKLPLNKATAFFYKHKEGAKFRLNSAFSSTGVDVDAAGSVTIEDFNLYVTDFNQTFYKCTNLGKFGNFVNDYTSGKISIGSMFMSCTGLKEVGLITTAALSNNSYNIFSGCAALEKINGFSVPSQQYQGEIVTSSSYRLLGATSYNKLEECLNIPIGYLRFGGTNIGNLYGTASSIKPLRRLTFCQSNEGYYTKNNAKNLPIQYCSFDRDGMLEVFNTIPDASDVTATSTITITGNPCVADGTLTEEDIAIATAKGYVVTTA